MLLAIAVGLFGAVGAVLRYVTDWFVTAASPGRVVPNGTWVVNLAGSFVIGIVTGLAWYHGLGASPRSLVATGLCGGLTTWSAASYETVRLAETGRTRLAAFNLVGGLAASCLVAAAGIALAGVL
jgi:CrcB protein